MILQVFPASFPGLEWNVRKSPRFSTLVQTSVDLSEVRLGQTIYPLWSFVLSWSVLRDLPNVAGPSAPYNELKTLGGFFLNRYGSLQAFLFDDPSDDSMTAQGFGTGDGATQGFQLVRTWGGFIEPVQNINAVAAVYDNASLVNPANYSVGSTGIVTFATPPVAGHALTADFTFYYRCRFKDDVADFNQFMKSLWENKGLTLYGSPANKV